jgi:hypothetical protein
MKTTPNRTAQTPSTDATTTAAKACKPALRLAPRPRVRFNMSERAARRHLTQFARD